MQNQAQLNMRRMVRPMGIRKIAKEVSHFSVIDVAELVESDTKYTDTGKQIKVKK